MIQCVMDTLGMGEGSVEKKSWLELKTEVNELRRQLACLSVSVPSSLSFRTLADNRERIYFLSAPTSGWEMTLLFVDVSPTENVRTLKWHPLVEPGLLLGGWTRFTREEQLQWERKRLATWGITSYEIHIPTGKIVFPAASTLYHCADSGFGNGVLCPSEIRSCPSGAKLSPQICPTYPYLVAYVNNNDIWVSVTSSGSTERLTYSCMGKDDPQSAGNPSYVMQEEFNRYQGFWWQPCSFNGIYRILYEEVDESAVGILRFPGTGPNESEELRFPRAGSPNARSDLKIVQFRLTDTLTVTDIQAMSLRVPLLDLFPWAEYMVRAGWTPKGHHVWVQMLDRRQKRLDLALISPDDFVEVNRNDLPDVRPCLPSFKVIHQETSDVWINVNDLLVFMPYEKDATTISYIFASEETGFRHLYLHQYPLSTLNGSNSSDHLPGQKVALTSGEWAVVGKKIWLDVTRQLVFFLALRETPLEKHLYVVSLRRPGELRLLSVPGHSYSASFNEDCSMVVAVYSNTHTLPACQAFRVHMTNWSVEGVSLEPAGFLLEPRPALGTYCPTLYQHHITSGDQIFAMVFRPHTFEVGRKYPTVVNVYGGPEVQLVSNTFKGMRQLRMHMLAARGYCVVAIDSRGSQHRGLAFEGHLKRRMGTVELADQVEVLRHLANQIGCIDMSRVAIHGWSYGGYLSLMALVQHPDIFKVAIAGAPVTSWHLYDTGYTERYMDLPELNPMGYSYGSVLSYVKEFPEEENRLLIFHGLIDENVHFFHTSEFISALVKEGKPYQLQVYPNERHSLRNMDASKHYETMLLSFLQNHL